MIDFCLCESMAEHYWRYQGIIINLTWSYTHRKDIPDHTPLEYYVFLDNSVLAWNIVENRPEYVLDYFQWRKSF